MFPKLINFLLGFPCAHQNASGTHITMRCRWCGDSINQQSTHLGIKIFDVKPGQPIEYHCFQPHCKAGGALKTDDLIYKFNCTDSEVLAELANHNATISKTFDKDYKEKSKKNYNVVNLRSKANKKKLDYINNRLGTDWDTSDLRKYKIQLGLSEYLKMNDIKKLTASLKKVDMLDNNGIGFVSAFDDYIIIRDCSEKLVTGKRYNNYRIRHEDSNDPTKMYAIPCSIDLTTPEPAVFHVAEGAFSILGAYLHTHIEDRDLYINQIFLANCGTGYLKSISQICKEYGLVDIIVHIYSDAGIKKKFYEELLASLLPNVYIRKLVLHFNDKAEDFGYPAHMIKIRSKTLYEAYVEDEGGIRI